MRDRASSEHHSGASRSALTWAQRLAVFLGPWLIRALAATWRIRTVNAEVVHQQLRDQKPFIFALWHGQMLPLLWQQRGQGIAILISEHRDGELIAQIAERLGYRTIRGSTTRGAARALLALTRELEHGTIVAVTPDGPKGPLHSFAPGALVAAQRARVPIIPIGFDAARAWRLKSWDRFTIPKPFARVMIAYGDPAYVDAADARASAEQAGQFGQILHDTIRRAGTERS